jgi:hypothetical protein
VGVKMIKKAKILPILCTDFGETPNEAWDNFQEKLDIIFAVVKGFMYWRVAPHLNYTIDFDTNKTIFKVESRITISDIKLPNVKQIKQYPPYEKNSEQELRIYSERDLYVDMPEEGLK